MPVENPTVAPPQPDSASRPGPLKVGFVSLGCPKNLVDSEVMMGMLQTVGAQITTRAEDADVDEESSRIARSRGKSSASS